MHNINTVLDIRKGLIPKDPNPDIFDVLWGKKLAGSKYKILTILGNPLSFVTKKAQTAISTKISMEPIQDLHGYDNPWPEGGGKNILNLDTFSTRSNFYTENSDGTLTVVASDTLGWSNIQPMSLKAGTYTFSRSLANGKCYIRSSDDDYTSNIIVLTTGLYATFTLNADGGIKIRVGEDASSYPFTDKYQIEAGSSVTSWSPYSNICPISGRTGVEIDGCGKNLFNIDNTQQYPINDEQILRYGVKVINQGTYYISCSDTSTSGYLRVAIMNADGTRKQLIHIISATTYVPTSFTLSNGEFAIIFDGGGDTFEVAKTLLNGWKIQLELGSEATIYEPYQQSNDVTIIFPALGKNLFDPSVITDAGVGLTYKSFSIPNGIYTMSSPDFPIGEDNTTTNLFFLDSQVKSGASSSENGVSSGVSRTITVTDGYYTVAYRKQSTGNSKNPNNYKWQIESGSTATTYEPYTNTVYGGTLDVEKGELTIDMGYVDFGSLTWDVGIIYGYNYWRTIISNKKPRTSSTSLGNMICDELTQIISQGTAIRTALENNTKCFSEYLNDSTGGITVIGYDTSITSDQFKTLMSGVQLVYELATPITISLTPKQVQLLKGANTLWTDGDEIELTYKA